MPRILIVDDDSELRRFLRQELELDGYTCSEASGGTQALLLMRSESWDLLLLDWSLPDFTGIELCRRLRKTSDRTPILMLTAHGDIPERVEALDAGADDYLTKPFSIEELLARVRARIRRNDQDLQPLDSPLCSNGVVLNFASREVSRYGQAVNLTNKEFELLQLLLRFPDQVLERSHIMKMIWGDDWYGDSNILDVYIRALRRKLDRPNHPPLIHTVRGVGFMLKAN